MATLIRLKRKKSSGNAGIVLAAGEAYYNTADKRLYIGNEDGEEVLSDSKKHIVQITPLEAGGATVKFQLGEDTDNVYEKKIIADAIGGTISSAKDATNVTSTIAGTEISSLFNMSSNKPTKAKSAASADSATTAATANDVTNLSLASSSEATIKLTWGPKSEHSTSFTVSGESIGGTVTSAENVTKYISGNAITDIFSGTVAKKASQLNNARNLTTQLDSTTAGSFNGTGDVTIGVSGTLPIASGGTGATTAAKALTNLGINATTTELNYLKDATGNIQTQLAGKAPKSHASSSTTYGAATTSDYGHVKISNDDVATTTPADGLAAGMDHSHSNYLLKSELTWKEF